MNESAAAATRATALLLSNDRVNDDIHRAVLRLPIHWGPSCPGQFVQVECPPSESFGMWRPFSISRFRAARLGPEIELVYGVVGLRTRNLSRLVPGETVTLIGPLGRGFERVANRRPVLIGGGRGVAPMIGLAEAWSEAEGRLLYGARSARLLIPIEDSPFTVWLATEDGSAGLRGTVIDLLDRGLERGELSADEIALYSCGPNRMLAAISAWAGPRAVPCQVSLETHFGCGVGICAGCAVPVIPRDGEDAFARYRFACVEGPVMDGTRVEWEGVAE